MKLKLLVFLFPIFAIAQGYTSYFTGNPTNITTPTQFGVCLMGGATEHDNAMIWLLQKANGGDVVVLRSSGSDGYNDYLYSDLGVNVNSVETLVITSVAGATNPYVLNKVANAEMIWFAGGDQYNYVSYFKDNALEDLINDHVNVKHAPIGGTSAGMAILGGNYFSAQNGTVTSAEALNNPFHPNVTLSNYTNEFLQVPFLGDVITDTHYDNPDRRGRHVAFMARLNMIVNTKGIACNEYVAVCIGSDGIAHVYGDYPNYDEFTYFILPDCHFVDTVEICQPGISLTWNLGGRALWVYKVPGTPNGTHYFDLNLWQNAIGSGGSWENWFVVNGVFNVAENGEAPNCLLRNDEFTQNEIQVFPNPFDDFITLNGIENASVEIFDGLGKKVFSSSNFGNQNINTSLFSSGLYFVRMEKEGRVSTKKLVKN